MRLSCAGVAKDRFNPRAMEAQSEPNYEAALLDPTTAARDQQGMSPSTVVAAAAVDSPVTVSGAGQSAEGQAVGYGAAETGVAVRAMTVAVTSSPAGTQQPWSPPQESTMTAQVSHRQEVFTSMNQPGFEGVQNAAQAAWSMSTSRPRSVPMWVQRLGAFFQEMRAQPPASSIWAPSPMSSPPQQGARRALESPESGRDAWRQHQRAFVPGQQSLLSRDQHEQLQRMERSAPLLYGPPQRSDRGHESSGGSTYEAVQDEVRKQLRGVVEQLEASRQEASELRREVVKLKAGQFEGNQRPSEELPVQPQGPPRAFGSYLAGPSSMSTRGMSGEAHSGIPPMPTRTSMEGTSGLQARTPTEGTSGLHARTSTEGTSGLHARTSMEGTSGLHARTSTEGTSGLHARTSTESTPGLQARMTTEERSGVHAGPSMSTASMTFGGSPMLGSQAGEEPKKAKDFSSAAVGSTGNVTGEHGVTGREAGDPMSRLLEGLENVIKGGKPEELSKVTEGPKLAEISDSSSVDFGDWLYCLEHTMGDLSTSSAEWWKLVLKDAQEYYERYQAADQYSRLSMKPTPSLELGEPKWTRVDRRGASILLGAVPEDVKKELIASRTKSTLDVLARLMLLYRPGSAMEKGQLLRKIESPEPATTTQEAVEGLRQWLRYYQRARDLKLSTPDPSLLVKSLDAMLKKPVAENPEVGFRMNLLRYHLKVDFSPSEDSVLAIHRAFLAEFEQMGYKKRKPPSDTPSAPRVRALEKAQPQLPMSPTTGTKG